MAELNEKILNTRIQLKYDTYNNWKTYNPVLKKGELAIVEVPAETGAVIQEPNLLLKVGDGEKAFLALDFIAAKAADVHDWAKAAAKPSYTIQEIGGYDTIDTDTQYKLVQDGTDGHVIKLQSMPKGGTTWTDVATITTVDTIFDDTELKNRLDDLESKVGETTVQAAIEAYVTSLDLANTYGAKGEAAKAQAAAEKTASDNLNAAKGELHAAIQQVQGEVDALEEYVGTFTPVGEEKDVVGYIDAKVAQINTEAGNLAGRVSANEGAISELQTNSATKTELGNAKTELQGKIDLKAAQADHEALAGRVTTVEGGVADLLANSATKTELGQAKTELQGKIDLKAAQADLDTANGKITANEAAIAENTGKLTTLIGDDAGKSARTIAVEELTKQLVAEGADASLDTLQEIAKWIQDHPGDAAAMNAAIETLQSGSATKAELEAAVATINEALGTKATQADLTAAVNRIKANEDAIAALQTNSATKGELNQAKTDLQGNIDKKADQTALDATNGRVTANEGAIAGLNTKVDTGEQKVSEYVAAQITAQNLGQYAKQADHEALAGRVTANEGAIADLNTNKAEKTVVEGLATEVGKKAAQTDLDTLAGRVTATENTNTEQGTLIEGLRADLTAEAAAARAAEAANAKDIAALEASVNGLANIAKTGSTDDLVQGTMTLVFNCGDANC